MTSAADRYEEALGEGQDILRYKFSSNIVHSGP